MENAARDESSIIELSDAIEPIEFAETHREEVELLEHIGEMWCTEVEEGHLTPQEALEEIKGLLAAAEEAEEDHGDEDDHGEEEEDHDEDEDDHGEEEEDHDEDEDDHGEEEEDHDEDEDRPWR